MLTPLLNSFCNIISPERGAHVYFICYSFLVLTYYFNYATFDAWHNAKREKNIKVHVWLFMPKLLKVYVHKKLLRFDSRSIINKANAEYSEAAVIKQHNAMNALDEIWNKITRQKSWCTWYTKEAISTLVSHHEHTHHKNTIIHCRYPHC